jgi:AcrR family transcriptional regulator
VSRVNVAASRPVGVHFEGDLRRALLDAAVASVQDLGAEHLSLREVARRTGVSHAAPAHHFGDKAGLLTAIATEGFELFLNHLAAAVGTTSAAPVDQLLLLGRAYAEFAERYPGYFDVMFRPAIIRTDDAAYTTASDAAFEALRQHIEQCQLSGWRPDADNAGLTAAAWSLAHGISVLRTQGSLARHYPDASLDGVMAIGAALIVPSSPSDVGDR